MKKLLKSVLALTLVLAITFAFAGCKIVMVEGEWTCNKMRSTVSYAKTEVDLLQLGGNLELVLNEDGTMSFEGYIPPSMPFAGHSKNIKESGNWSLDGEIVKLDGKNDYELTWDNNKLIYTIEVELIDPDVTVDGNGAKLTIVCEFIPKVEKE